MRFLKSNFLLVIMYVAYFILLFVLFQSDYKTLAVIISIHGFTVIIALSPIGEGLLRLLSGARTIRMNREREFFESIFDSVYEEAKLINPSLSKGIRLYIDDDMAINSYAIGSNTVVITRGMIETMTVEQIQGVIAHELGHIANGDTRLILLLTVGSGIFSILLFALRSTLFFANILYIMLLHIPFVNLLVIAVRYTLELSILLFVILFQILLGVNRRTNEFMADSFAHSIGYGVYLIEALYLLYDVNMSQKLTLLERIRSSHPHLSKRIERLEDR